jgi:hypothetical protein
MQRRRAYPITREHRPVAQLGLTSYGTWKLFTTGYSGNEDTAELSDVATDSPEEASTLEQAKATPAVADCLSRYIFHDEALASVRFQETSDRRDGNGCRFTNEAHGVWFRVNNSIALHHNVRRNSTNRGELGLRWVREPKLASII